MVFLQSLWSDFSVSHKHKFLSNVSLAFDNEDWQNTANFEFELFRGFGIYLKRFYSDYSDIGNGNWKSGRYSFLHSQENISQVTVSPHYLLSLSFIMISYAQKT